MKSLCFFRLAAGVLCSTAATTAVANADPQTHVELQILTDPVTQERHPLPDFSYAGYGFGTAAIPHFEQTIDVADFGAIPDDGKDDSQAILSALAAAEAHDGPVRLQLDRGRYIVSEILWLERSSIVLAGKGMGEGGTELFMPRPLNQIDDGGQLTELREYLAEEDKYVRNPDTNLDRRFSEYSWTAGFIWSRVPGGRHTGYLERYERPIEKLTDIASGEQFAHEVRVDDTSRLSVGDVLQIIWYNRQGPQAPLIASLYGSNDLEVAGRTIGSRHWENPEKPVVQQMTKIVSIAGDRVQIADPLLHPINDAVPAEFSRWDHLQDVGIEDLRIVFPENPYFGHHNEAGFNGIYLAGVHNGWIRNVRIENADNGILSDDSANITMANIVSEGTNEGHYAVHLGNVHNVLVDTVNVFNKTEHSLSFNTRSTRSVFKDAVVWTTPTLDQHSGSNHQNLYDNVTVHIRPDRVSADGLPEYDLYKGGGAPYWQPGHGQYNTTWNLNVVVSGPVEPGETISILGGSEGPNARIVGMHGNRPIRLSYTPEPYVEALNKQLTQVPSLYDYQLARRTMVHQVPSAPN
jgi:hypothetical protein